MFRFTDHIFTGFTPVVKTLAVSAVCLLTPQSAALAQNSEFEHVRFGQIARYADLLSFTFQDMVREMQSWDQTSGGEAALDHLKTKDIIPQAGFPRVTGRAVESWGIRARRCDDYLIVYFKDNGFKANIKPEEIRVVQKLRHQRFGETHLAANKKPLGWINANSLTDQHGVDRAIPACMDNNYATPLPRNGVAMMGRAVANGLYANTRQIKEYRKTACLAPLVGAGFREERIKFVPFNGKGAPINADITYGSWSIADDNCRAPRTRKQSGAPQVCNWTLAGKTQQSQAVYSYLMKEVQDPTDPFKTVEVAVNQDGTLSGNPQGELIIDLCDTTPIDNGVQSTSTRTAEIRERVCASVYPVPLYDNSIPYSLGKYTEERFKNVLVQTYGWNRPPLNVTSYTDWEVKEDTCHRNLFSHTTVNNRTDACTHAGDQGDMRYAQSIDYYKKDYAKVGRELTFADSEQLFAPADFELQENTCRHTTVTTENVRSFYQNCGRDNGQAWGTIYDIVTRTIWHDGRPTTSSDVTVRNVVTNGCTGASTSTGGGGRNDRGDGDAGDNGRNGGGDDGGGE